MSLRLCWRPDIVGSVWGPCIANWTCRVMSSVRVAEAATSGGDLSAIDMAVAGRPTLIRLAHA